MSNSEERVWARLSASGATASADQVMQLASYLDFLMRWNARMNLTALESEARAIDRLLVEPVIAAAAIDDGARLLVDVGTGGGSPAIPLKIMRPELRLAMVEVKTRKCVFLREAVRHLGLSDTEVLNGRFEDVLVAPDLTGQVDTLSVRAVRVDESQLALFAEALRPGGQQLWFLSGAQALPTVPGGLRQERTLPLISDLDSRLVLLRREVS